MASGPHFGGGSQDPRNTKTAFLTVGSTQFTQLVKSALSHPTLSKLHDIGIRRLVVQKGTSQVPDEFLGDGDRFEEGVQLDGGGYIEVEIWKYRDRIEDLMDGADLVISHAGSGSILSALRPSKGSDAAAAQRPLIVVPNDSLMDSHQSDLAEELGSKRWARVATPGSLAEVVGSIGPIAEIGSRIALSDGEAGPTFPVPEPSRFRNMLDRHMGYP